MSRLASLKSLADVPGPKGLPLIGTSYDWFSGRNGISFQKFFEVHSKRAAEYGPIHKEQIGTVASVIVNDLGEYRKIMQKEGKMPARMQLEPLVHYRKCKGMGAGLSANGPEWLRYRNAVSKKLLRPEEVKSFAPAMNAVADDLVDYISKGLDDRGRYKNSLEDTMFRWALESVGTALLGTRIGALDDSSDSGREYITSVHGMFDGMMQLLFSIPIYKIFPTPRWRTFEGHCERLFRHGASILSSKFDDTQARERVNESVLGQLIHQGSELSKSEVEVLVVELMSASVETVANTVLWCLYGLSRPDNDSQDKLYDEVCSLFSPGKHTTIDSTTSMPYLKSCVKETLRLYPQATLTSRFLQEDMEVCGYKLPAGTLVQANVYHMNRSDSLFDRPQDFRPDRWIGMHSTDASIASQLVWGHGARMCLGRRLAEQEAYILLSKLVQRYRIQYDGEVELQPIQKLFLHPHIPVKIRFIKRC